MRHTLPRVREASEFQVSQVYELIGVPPHVRVGHLTISLADYEWTDHAGGTELSVAERSSPLEPGAFEEQLANAEATLEELTDNEPWEEVEAGLFQTPWGDGLDIERIVCCAGLALPPINGDPVVFPAERDVVLLTGSADKAGLSAMAGVAGGTIIEREEWFTSVPLRRVAGRWTTWYPEDVFSELDMFRQIRLFAWMDQYPEQQEVLVERDASRRVAPYSVAEVNGEQTAMSLLLKSGPTLLPRADLIEFGDNTDANAKLMREALIAEGAKTDPEAADGGIQGYMRRGYVRWPSVAEVFASRLIATDLWPPRYTVDGFTDDDLGRVHLLHGT